MNMTLLDCFNAGLITNPYGDIITSRAQLDGWITVHPNGEGTKGVPVLLGPDGTVQGGMGGGKFNGKHVSEVKATGAPVKMTEREYVVSKGVSWNTPTNETLHMNRNKSERLHQAALAKLSAEQNEWFNRKQQLLKEYESKVASGEIIKPGALELLSKKAESKPGTESGQAAARLKAKIEARRAAKGVS